MKDFVSITLCLFSLSSKDDVLEFDTKISEDDMGGNSNSTSEFDLGTAVELLGLDDDDAKTQASRLQGAYVSFLLLRHLRLRDLQRSVRNAPYTTHGGLTCMHTCISVTGVKVPS